MSKSFQDKQKMSSAYRAVLMFRTVIIVVLIVLVSAIVLPQDNGYYVDAVCAAVIIPALLYQIHIDRTLIFANDALVDDGEYLYVVIGSFNMGFGRLHHARKKIKKYRISCIESVKRVKVYSFGIAVRAEVYTATHKKMDVEEELFDTPGAMREQLMEKGKRKTVLFRLERNLETDDEDAFLQRLKGLSFAA